MSPGYRNTAKTVIDGYNPDFRDSGFRKLVKTVNLDDFRKYVILAVI